MAMAENYKVCMSCKKRITNQGGGVADFKCPSCLQFQIIRCRHCRENASKYTCPNCGFSGPNYGVLMATIVVTMKIMPDSPDADLAKIESSAKEKISRFGGEVAKSEHVPIAFGLKAITLYFVMDEKKGSTDNLEKEISEMDEVQSVEITDVRRAIG